MGPQGLSPCLHAEVRYGTQAWCLYKNTLLGPWALKLASERKHQAFGGLSATGEIRRSNELQHMQGQGTGYAFIHWQSP